jgi:hypothetical protein
MRGRFVSSYKMHLENVSLLSFSVHEFVFDVYYDREKRKRRRLQLHHGNNYRHLNSKMCVEAFKGFGYLLPSICCFHFESRKEVFLRDTFHSYLR